jgi:cytochrome c oxidase subunit 1
MHDMSAQAHAAHAGPTGFIRKHVFSLDHKVIGKQYYGLALLAAIIGMFLSWVMRIHLGWTNFAIPGLHLLSKNGAPGDVMTPEYYLQLMTMHGTIMVFFVLTTAPFAAFGNFFLPIQVGAEDMPFPRFNMMSFWVTSSFPMDQVWRAGPNTLRSARLVRRPVRARVSERFSGRRRSLSFASASCLAP